MGGVGSHQYPERIELIAAGAIQGLLIAVHVVEVEVQPDRKARVMLASSAAALAPGLSAIRLALVTIPRSCASKTPALTPPESPRSSALTINVRFPGGDSMVAR